MMSHRKMIATLSAAFGSRVSCCESNQSKSYHDTLFDIQIPGTILVDMDSSRKSQQDLFATAHRCMNNWCFLKPARAYVLGLFVDKPVLNRLKSHALDQEGFALREDVFKSECPKSFVLFFASSKDAKHIKKGFTKSFENFASEQLICDMKYIRRFLSVLDGRNGLTRGDFIRVSCNPANQTVYVSFNDEAVVRIDDAKPLIDWVHSLYLGLESNPTARYEAMKRQLSLAQPL